jgi:hypothetical protein
VVACFAILIGVQLMMFGALARRYQMIEGVLPPIANFKSFLLGFSLERILQVAGVVFVGGAAGIVWAVMHWASLGFGPIPYNLVMRVLVISLTAVASAIQLAAAGFLASMFTLRR